MKSLLSTPALAEKICDMKDRREKANTSLHAVHIGRRASQVT